MDVILGNKYVDKATGFSGRATAQCSYLYSEPRVLLEVLDSQNKLCEEWFPVARLVLAQ